MIFLDKILKLLRGDSNQQKPAGDKLANWQNKKSVKIDPVLKNWVTAFLKENQHLVFTWESGGDEEFITFENAGEISDKLLWKLEEYITKKLDIPSAGEFQMNGQGLIYLNDNIIMAKYSSVMKEIVDYNEETEEEVFGEQDELDNGEQKLFELDI